ncbi:MAG: SHOCT domain-containing protein [Actinomycetota bacterium]|nr:SHOCT domain-containing protein [Actinomycetota bacterium]
MWWDDGMAWGGWIAMTLMMTAFWVFVAVIVVLAIRASQADPGTGSADPRQILDARLARGEIDLEEYRARRDALTDSGQ